MVDPESFIKYCKQNGMEYQTENTKVAQYLSQLSLKEYIGAHAPEKVVVLADSGYDDKKIKKAIATKHWKFISALKSTRSVKTEKAYLSTKKTQDWKSVAVTFKNNRKFGWKTIRAPKNGGKNKRKEFRVRQITGYLKNFRQSISVLSSHNFTGFIVPTFY